MPRAVYVLALGIFAMVTSEFVVAGLMPQMADGLNATVPQIGYLITAFAVAMAAGGPFLTVALMKLPPRTALMVLFAVFLTGNVLAATATGYGVMMAARIITGIASQAFFGIGISLCARITRPEVRGRAIAVAMNGLMLGTLLGLPLSTLVGERYGWRAAFWAISALALVAAVVTLVGVPRLEAAASEGGFRQEIGVFRNPKLWLVLSTSMLVIGATFSAFSYLNPILTEVTGFSAGTVPLLLIAYGAATVVGNTVVGRLADRYAVPVLAAGLVLNTMFLAGFALLADLPAPAVLCMLGIGLVGVTMNPAMITRVQRTGNAGPLVNTVHSSFITLGIIVGSSLGAVGIDAWSLRAPLWLGAVLALLGLATLVPELSGGRSGKPAEPTPSRPVPAASGSEG
ncbi:MFS transporter [Streptomyces cyaneogriseus subsp. noncyanogenus]|uniref:MFS transporter n=1 Tax=Streptomyces cyaneogriseus subsp. noncyanogenus TaxID=477245 RepID=A0A0C5GFT4_9ACTN|nr:MFS transporter [Streptomyces cyaneogriseus]AJP03241.1 MFS transporter [Streptomyces cyaneogriseus subsp. noncyanogenus]